MNCWLWIMKTLLKCVIVLMWWLNYSILRRQREGRHLLTDLWCGNHGNRHGAVCVGLVGVFLMGNKVSLRGSGLSGKSLRLWYSVHVSFMVWKSADRRWASSPQGEIIAWRLPPLLLPGQSYLMHRQGAGLLHSNQISELNYSWNLCWIMDHSVFVHFDYSNGSE